jgi:hypothetical protein
MAFEGCGQNLLAIPEAEYKRLGNMRNYRYKMAIAKVSNL